MTSVVISYLKSCSLVEIMGWVTAGISLTGAFFNANRKWYSFLIWMVANISWVTYDVFNKCYSQAALFSAYLLMNIYGLYCWKIKKSKLKDNLKTEADMSVAEHPKSAT